MFLLPPKNPLIPMCKIACIMRKYLTFNIEKRYIAREWIIVFSDTERRTKVNYFYKNIILLSSFILNF
jgi:hypothetical protein